MDYTRIFGPCRGQYNRDVHTQGEFNLISFSISFFGMRFFQPVMGAATWTGFTVFQVILGIMILLPVGRLIFFAGVG